MTTIDNGEKDNVDQLPRSFVPVVIDWGNSINNSCMYYLGSILCRRYFCTPYFRRCICWSV